MQTWQHKLPSALGLLSLKAQLSLFWGPMRRTPKAEQMTLGGSLSFCLQTKDPSFLQLLDADPWSHHHILLS